MAERPIAAVKTGRGEMSEWLKEPVLKTGDVEASVGSNPSLAAKFNYRRSL